MWSAVRRAVGAIEPGYLGEWHAFRGYFANVSGRGARELAVWFEADLLPGYAWSFPLPDGRVNIGFGVLRDGLRKGREMSALWDELLQRTHIAGALGDGVELEGRHATWPIPAAIDRAVLAAGRVLFVGDAARATDVLTGEGIGQALVTGRLAAEAIVAGGAEAVDPVARGYDREARRHLLADHRMSKVLNGVLRHRRGANGALALADLNDWTRRRFVRFMFEDEPRAVAFTPRRWHRHLFERPGPYAEAV
jgi:flavin-dependent dehydrogenase